MEAEIAEWAERIWDYHLMGHQIAKADAILVLCSHDERVAERGAQLFLDGWAPLLIFSGGQGAITKTLWSEPEAEPFTVLVYRAPGAKAGKGGAKFEDIKVGDKISVYGESTVQGGLRSMEMRLPKERMIRS